jgi:N-acetylglucosaminyldiphosphoundecaprenol N-acetyl-beta-D-mannosaminyltransferase
MEKVQLLNTQIDNLSMQETINSIDKMIQTKQKSYIVAVNVDVVMKIEKDPVLKQIVKESDLALADGKPLIWISRMQKQPIKEKISGSDLVPKLCHMAAEKGYTIFILGGKDGIAEKAKQRLEQQYPSIRIVGVYAPPIGFEKDPSELEKINRMISQVSPNLLIVCFGCPKQEKFIYENIEYYNADVSICAGATVNFLAGNVKRAPKWMSDHGLEWFYRFLQEPRRLFKRYFIDDIKILGLLWKYRRKTSGKGKP